VSQPLPIPASHRVRPCQAGRSLPRVNPSCDIRGSVDVGLKRRNVAVIVRTPELGLRVPPTDAVARVARLRGVRRIHVSTGIPASVALSSMRPFESGERPRVKPTVHVLPVVETLTDVRQVLHHQHRIFKLLGVLESRPFLHDVGEGVLVVVEPFVGTPLEASRSFAVVSGVVHLFSEMLRSASATHERVSRRTVLEGTARDEGGFSEVEGGFFDVAWRHRPPLVLQPGTRR